MHSAVRHVLATPGALFRLLRAAAKAWQEDDASSMGAAISYYTVFSIAPLFLIVLALVGFVYGGDALTGRMFVELRGLMGDEAAAGIQGLVKSASNPASGALATTVGTIAFLLGATTVFGELQSTLDRIWRAPPRKSSGLWALVCARLMSFGMILGIGFLLLVSLVASAAIAALSKYRGAWLPQTGALLHALDFVISTGVITALFALIFKLLPRRSIDWHDVWIGAAVTALLFTLGKFLIGLYLGHSSVASTFGAAGSLAVLLVWIYYSAQIFLLGAEFTWVYAYTYGSYRHEPPPAPTAAAASNATAAANESLVEARQREERERAAWTRARQASGHARLELGLAVALAALAAWVARVTGRLR